MPVFFLALLFLASAAPAQDAVPASALEIRGETVMKALAAAYPDQIGEAAYRNGDWAVNLRGEWFYYAQGRLLPESLRSGHANYDSQPFYPYPAELPPLRNLEPAETDRLRNAVRRRQEHPPRRSRHFFDALYRAPTRSAAYERVKTMRFLGRSVLVHYSIMEELALVENRINQEARTNLRIRQWVSGINQITAWNWRNIAQTESRSFHAYGVAVDILPANYRSRGEAYWLWAAEKNLDWWLIPHERRLHPPAEVIRIFESYGFVWGGKWMFYDAMHFEYRPEILILNNLSVETW